MTPLPTTLPDQLPTTTLPITLVTTTLTLALATTTLTRLLSTTTLSLPLVTTTVTLALSTTTLANVLSTTTLALPLVTTTTLTVPSLPTTLPPLTTTSLPLTDVCPPGGCDDGDPCTADVCDLGLGCLHTPLDLLGCSPSAADDLCQVAGVGSGCTDDGFACTDDVCTVAGCLHVPVDSRCVAAGQCTLAACQPARPERDAAGCVAGPARAEGQACAEDADPCTADVCRGGACVHDAVSDPDTCAPVQGAFQEAIALEGLSEGLLVEVAAAPPGTAAAMTARLEMVRDDLAAAARALAGEPDGIAPMARGGAVTTDMSAQERARIAFTRLLHTPRAITSFLRLVENARSQFEERVARSLRRSGRRLLRGTKVLRGQLKHIRHGAPERKGRR